MNKILIRAYHGLISKGHITLDRIPQEYQQAVLDYDPEKDVPVPDEPEDLLFGAITLGSIHKEFTGEPVEVTLDELFTPARLGEQPAPYAPFYTLVRIENIYGEALHKVSCLLEPTETGFTLHVDGSPLNLEDHQNIVRVDVRIGSMNYEDMDLTVYLVT